MTAARTPRPWRVTGNRQLPRSQTLRGLDAKSTWEAGGILNFEPHRRWLLPRQSQPQISEIGSLIRSWMEANLWTTEQTVELARQYQPGSKSFSRHELEGLLTGKPIDPSPRLFQGMAAVHQAVAGLPIPAGGMVSGLTALESTVMASSPLTLDAQADRASWWFAVFSNEPNCMDSLCIPADYRKPEKLSPQLSRYLRRLMISLGMDPVEEGMIMLSQLFSNSTKCIRSLHAWMLGMRELSPQDLHFHAPQLALLIHSLDNRITSIHALLEELRLQEESRPLPARSNVTSLGQRFWRQESSLR